MLRRDFGQRFDSSPNGAQHAQKSSYTIESGRIPTPPDNSYLQEKFRKWFHPSPEQPVPEPFTNIELGARDPETPLPICDYKDVIKRTVQDNQITIVVAETGAGKSTQVPQYLLEAGYTVTMTQPRRMAARMLSERIGDEIATAFDDPTQQRLVGLHTAEHNTITEDTRISVVTDGLRLVQELNARGDVENEILIIDEVHEWNTNIEVLIAWSKKMAKERPNMRVVLMSATMDAHRLADYFADTGNRPPIIEVPGRTHNVEKIEESGSTVFDQTVKYAQDGKNILVFLPGVREIGDMKKALEDKFESMEGMDNITVLPLHSKVSDQEQKAVDRQYPGPKIILATNLAQTSLTISDIDVVVDSGLERRKEIDDEGIQSLRLHAISKADCDQRAGRAGRTHAGTYVLTRMDNETKYVPYISREEYPTPEILRSDIDRNTLGIAKVGLDLSTLGILNSLKPESVSRARHSLQLLGALDGEGRITQRGRRMDDFPVHPTSARMLIESDNYSDEVRSYVSAIVSAVEVGKLPSYLYTANKNWRELTDEQQSDHLTQLDIFIATQDMHKNRELHTLGLDVRNVKRARELHKKITKRAGMKPQPLRTPTEKQRAEIVECVTAGLVDFVYTGTGRETVVRLLGANATERTLSNRSTVQNVPGIAVATPYGYRHHTKGEQHVVESVTATTPEVLGKVARSLCTYAEQGSVTWRDGKPFAVKKLMFRDVIATGDWREEPADPSPGLREEIIQYVIDSPGNAQKELRKLKTELEKLRRLAGSSIPQFTQDDLIGRIQRATPEDITDPSLVDEHLRRAMVEENMTLDNLVPEWREIYRNSPQFIEQDGVTLALRYSNGNVHSNIKANSLNDIAALQQEVSLPDGRRVQLVYERKAYTLERLKERVEWVKGERANREPMADSNY